MTNSFNFAASILGAICIVLATLISFDANAAKGKLSDIRSGDLIFHQSKGPQANAILEATGSSWSHVGIIFEDKAATGGWLVAEASMPVRVVSLASFIQRGRNQQYRIYRARGFQPSQVPALRAAVDLEMGKPYDIYFEWSDTAIYCSELTYKAFMTAASIELGTVQKFSDLKLDGPYVQAMIADRLTHTGRKLNLNEPIVTPINQMKDSDLDLIVQTGP
ncbi:YiiX family permuted papain-like enzyme [soil metagenome]